MKSVLISKEKAINKFVFIRIAVGCFFIISGFEKLIRPYENFLYVVQSYELVGKSMAEIVARTFPWIEFILGVFFVFGLWIRAVLNGLLVLVLLFILTVSQALLRNLPIRECGCFGELFSVPLPTVLLFDSCLLVLMAVLKRFRQRLLPLSLDRYFQNKN